MKPAYKITLGVAVLALAGYLALSYSPAPNPSRLAQRALSSADMNDRTTAALELVMLKEPDPTPQLREVLEKSQDAGITVQALGGLANRLDHQSLPLFFNALNNPAEQVRVAALTGLRRFYGGALPDDLEYRADAPAEQRTRVIARLKELHDDLKKQPIPTTARVLVASAKETETAPETKTKDIPLVPTTPSPTPPPSPSPTNAPASPAPSPSSTISSPLPAPENAALDLLSWMCRILAIIVLLAEVAGAVALLLGDKKAARLSKQVPAELRGQAALMDEMEKIFTKNSAGLWSKMAILVAGAVTVIGLLIVAEMIQLAVSIQQAAVRVDQSAVRVEQKMDYLSRK